MAHVRPARTGGDDSAVSHEQTERVNGRLWDSDCGRFAGPVGRLGESRRGNGGPERRSCVLGHPEAFGVPSQAWPGMGQGGRLQAGGTVLV